ncbi:hypothetical protein JE950_002100 [Flavobacterium psychrophilum]|nr:hypothetical protein [Flavobacterium psychrophilum]
MLNQQKLNLKDKNGTDLPNDCIIYGFLIGQTKKHYFNLGRCKNDLSNEMIACTYGYVHNVEQKDLVNFELIGLTKDNFHLLECD